RRLSPLFTIGDQPGQAKVQHLGNWCGCVTTEENVARLYIEVQYAMGMGEIERGRHHFKNRKRGVEGKSATLTGPGGERTSFEVFRHQVAMVTIGIDAEIGYVYDPRVCEPSQSHSLRTKTLREELIRPVAVSNHFQREELAAETLVAGTVDDP